MDIDFLVDASLENEEKVYRVLEMLPDQAVKQLDPGDIAKFTVVRVADEIVVDLMQSACGIAEFLPEYRAAGDSVLRPVVVGNGHTRARTIQIGRGLERVILFFKSKSKSKSKSRSKTPIDRDFDRIGSDLLDCVGWMVGCGMGWRFRYEGEDGLQREVDFDFDFDFDSDFDSGFLVPLMISGYLVTSIFLVLIRLSVL
jgi:hypothetical protein